MSVDVTKFPLGELGILTSSKRIFKKEYVKGGIPFYRSKEIKELAHNKDISLELFITKERYEEIKNKFGIPKKGDIFIFTSPSTIKCFLNSFNWDKNYKAVAIGTRTASYFKGEIVTSEIQTIENCIKIAKNLL